MARSLSSPRPRTRVWLCLWRLTADGGSLSRALALSSVHSRCLPHRTAAARGGVPSFPSGSSVPPFVSGGWCAFRPPSGGRGSAPRRRPAALSPWLPGARAGRSRRRARGRDRARRGGGGPPSRVFHPRPLSGYLATAFRRVGLKTPGGVASPSPGSGGRRGPLGAVGVRRLPRTPVPHAAGGRSRGAPPRSGSGSPLSGARGARLRVPGSPVRRRSRAPCPSVPTRFPGVFLPCLSLAGPRRTPLRSPAASPRGGGWRGDCAAVSSYPKGKRSYDS